VVAVVGVVTGEDVSKATLLVAEDDVHNLKIQRLEHIAGFVVTAEIEAEAAHAVGARHVGISAFVAVAEVPIVVAPVDLVLASLVERPM